MEEIAVRHVGDLVVEHPPDGVTPDGTQRKRFSRSLPDIFKAKKISGRFLRIRKYGLKYGVAPLRLGRDMD